MPTRSVRTTVLGGASALVLLLTACGDDDEAADATRTTEAAAFDAEAYCAAADVLGNSDAPTAEQIEAYQQTAPEEIDGDVAVVVAAFAEAVETDDFSGLDSPAVIAATEALQAAELEHCGVVAGE